MIPCMCWVQEGQIPDETAQALQGELTAFAERSFGAAAFFNWLEIRKGNGFYLCQTVHQFDCRVPV